MWLILMLAAMQYTPDPPAAKTVGEWLAVCDADKKRCADQQATAQGAAAWLKARPELASAEAWIGINKAMVALHPCR